MLLFQRLILFFLFVYFFSFITGCPAQREKKGPTGREQSGQDFRLDPFLEVKKGKGRETPVELEFYWQPGLLQKSLVQSRAVRLFEDPLLESDSRPDLLMRALERSRTGDLILFILTVLWSIGLVLVQLALHYRHWFYRPMVLLIMPVSVILIFLILFQFRREAILDAFKNELIPGNALLLLQVYLESLLLFGGLMVILQNLLPETDSSRLHEEKFMSHLRRERTVPFLRVTTTMEAVFQSSLIVLAGIILANVILFPVYTLQLAYPQAFALLLVFTFLGLSWFYTRAYVQVSGSRQVGGSLLSGVAFLGFRLIRNTIYILSVVATVLAVITIIVVITLLNLDFMQTLNLLKKTGSF